MTTGKIALPPSSWGAQVAQTINTLRPIAPPNTLMYDGPFGFGSSQKPQNLRSKYSSTTASLPSCFQIASIASRTVSLTNCFLMAAGRLFSVGDETTGLMSVLIPSDYETAVIALALDTEDTEITQSSVSIAAFETLDDLIDAMTNPSKFYFPLYSLAISNGSASVVCDLRNIPTLSVHEY